MGDFQLDSAPLRRVDKKIKRQYLHIDRAPLRNGILLKLGYMDKKQLADDLRQALRAVQAAQVESDWQTDKPKRVEIIGSAMFLQIQIHLIGWIEKVDEAINDAEEPPEKRSMLWWGISLAGNLIWAATSLNGIGQTAKVAMSFVGAAIGTGVAEKARDAFSTEKGRKDILKKRIAALQGVFEQGFHDKRFDWASEFDSKRVIGRGYDEELSMFVWGKMFALPYKSDEGRYHQVYVNSKANIEKLLARFRDEWTRWNDGNKLINLSDGLGHLHIKPPTYKKNFDPDLEPVWKEMEMTFDMNRPLV